MTETRRPTVKKSLTAAAIAASLAIVTPFVLPTLTTFEAGRDRGKPYRDTLATGAPWTVCDGKLITDPRRYSDAECDAQTRVEVETRYGPPVLQCAPTLAPPERRQQLAAAILLAWNIGPAAFCRSTAARLFNAGQWLAGCNAFAAWNRAGGVVVRGLVNRRNAEMAICRKGL